MPRSYKNEAAWRKKKYTRVVVDLNPDTAEKFKSKLQSENTNCADWLRAKITEYINDETK